MTHWLVLPSPFLGSPAYLPLAAALRADGDTASVATYAEPPVASALVEAWAATAAGLADVTLVPHSNAGYLAPAVSTAAGGLPIVFMDAALPVTLGSTRLAPPAFRAHLVALARADGLLPRWTRWWPRRDVIHVLPDPWFERLDAVLPEVPLSYVDAEVPVPDGWERGPCAYLAFGAEAYADELARAHLLGWPVWKLEGARHLHCVLDPPGTSAAIREISSRSLGGQGRV